jgi:hypothetical protein
MKNYGKIIVQKIIEITKQPISGFDFKVKNLTDKWLSDVDENLIPPEPDVDYEKINSKSKNNKKSDKDKSDIGFDY